MDETIIRKNKFTSIWVPALLICTSIVIYFVYQSPQIINVSDSVFIKLKKTSFTNYLNFNGTIKTTSMRNIFPNVEGVISKIYVDTSDDVEIDQEILVVSSIEIEKKFQADSMSFLKSKTELNKIQYIYEMELLELELEQKKSQIEYLQRGQELDLYQKLVSSGAVSKIQFNELNTQFEKSKINLELAKAKYATLKVKGGEYIKNRENILLQEKRLLSYSERSIDSLTLKSPIKGKVITKKAGLAIGDFVTPGEVLFTIGSITELEVKIRVPASQISMLSVGSKVKIALEDTEIEGQVKLIASAVVNQFIDVFIRLPNKLAEFIRADQTVLVRVPSNLNSSVFIIRRPEYIDLISGTTNIFVVDKTHEKLIEKEIEILEYISDENALIVSGKNLIEGEMVLISNFKSGDLNKNNIVKGIKSE